MLSSRSALVVGGTKGIGLAIVRMLSAQGAKVTFTGRTKPDGEDIPNAEFIPADLSSVRATHELGEKLSGRDFDTAILTVGTITKPELTRTSEGVEEDLMVSYLSRFVLVAHHLAHADKFPSLNTLFIMGYPGTKTAPTNIDDLNFTSNPASYKQISAHLNTVVLNEALVYETQRRFPHLQVAGLSPGLIVSGIRDNFHGGADSGWLGWMAEKAIGLLNPSAQTYANGTVLGLVSNDALVTPMSYSQSGKPLASLGWVAEEVNRIKAWEVSDELVNEVMK